MEIATRRREQEVWQACDDLWAISGDMKNVTGDEIRERLVALGKSRGSPNEIYKYRKTWAHSRGLTGTTNAHLDDECDPITRAVRLVHDQLKGEASVRIEQLEQEFSARMSEKDSEISEHKKALDQVLKEFAELQKQHAASLTKVEQLNSQLCAEIDLRKAEEKEVMRERALLMQEKINAEMRIKDMLSAYEQQIKVLTTREKELIARYEQQILYLNDESRKLGQDYSDKLMDYKTKIINHEIVTNNLEKKLGLVAQENHRHLTQKTIYEEKIASLEKKHSSLEIEGLAKVSEIKQLRRENETLHKKLREQNMLMKKSELTIARLRAMNACKS